MKKPLLKKWTLKSGNWKTVVKLCFQKWGLFFPSVSLPLLATIPQGFLLCRSLTLLSLSLSFLLLSLSLLWLMLDEACFVCLMSLNWIFHWMCLKKWKILCPPAKSWGFYQLFEPDVTQSLKESISPNVSWKISHNVSWKCNYFFLRICFHFQVTLKFGSKAYGEFSYWHRNLIKFNHITTHWHWNFFYFHWTSKFRITSQQIVEFLFHFRMASWQKNSITSIEQSGKLEKKLAPTTTNYSDIVS